MSDAVVTVRELAAWGLDLYAPRDAAGPVRAPARVLYAPSDPRRPQHALLKDPALNAQRLRPDLLREMEGLEWELAVVDLGELLAFQRRLSFDPQAPPLPTASNQSAPELLRVTFGPSKPIEYRTVMASGDDLELQSADPNFHLRPGAEPGALLTPCSGSPFLEVAAYRGRWFLRDGYHRAYHLLRAGIQIVPAVVVWAKTLTELGADQPWFFPEEVLFSADPPRVTDFLDDSLVREYARPRFIKTVRLTMTTSYAPATVSGEQR